MENKSEMSSRHDYWSQQQLEDFLDHVDERYDLGKKDNSEAPYNNHYEIWIEGYIATSEEQVAERICGDGINKWWGVNFQDACERALKRLGYEMNLYRKESNTYWGCRLYDNEADARKSFG